MEGTRGYSRFRTANDGRLVVPFEMCAWTEYDQKHTRILAQALKACAEDFLEGPETVSFNDDGFCEPHEAAEDVWAETFDAASLARDFNELAVICDKISNEETSFLLHLGL